MMRCFQSGTFSTTRQNDQRWCVLRNKGTLGDKIVRICR